jgi:hypothetical protein
MLWVFLPFDAVCSVVYDLAAYVLLKPYKMLTQTPDKSLYLPVSALSDSAVNLHIQLHWQY